MLAGVSVPVVIGGIVGVTVAACATVALAIEVVARLRTAAPPRTQGLARLRWPLAGGVPIAAALVVITLGTAASLAHGGQARASRSVSGTNAADTSSPAGAKTGPAVGQIGASGSTAGPAGPTGAAGATSGPAVGQSGATGATAGPSAANAESAAPVQPAATGPAIMTEGSPLPVLVVFDGTTITLTGTVRSDAAQQRLSALAQAYSTTAGATVVNHLTSDPRVPDSTGIRAIEMHSVRFATGSSDVSPDYAPALGRVVAVMKSMPSVTVLVIGHADQRGNSQYNLRLSLARASSVVDYLITQGIGSDRLSAQGVGDGSPLTQQSDAAGLALNRRTEFVLYGLLAGL